MTDTPQRRRTIPRLAWSRREPEGVHTRRVSTRRRDLGRMWGRLCTGWCRASAPNLPQPDL